MPDDKTKKLKPRLELFNKSSLVRQLFRRFKALLDADEHFLDAAEQVCGIQGFSQDDQGAHDSYDQQACDGWEEFTHTIDEESASILLRP